MFKKTLSILMAIAMTVVAIPVVKYEATGAPTIITLDPGHGEGTSPDGSTGAGTSAGEQWGAVNELYYNLNISMYAKRRLEMYEDVIVYMTRTTNEECPDLSARAEMAANNNSDALIGIHNNMNGNPAAYGSQVFIPNKNYKPQIGTESEKCANNIMTRLVNDAGLRKNSIYSTDSKTGKYPDGSAADSLAVLRKSKELGVVDVVMVVECAFMSNYYDYAEHLAIESELEKMGYAIADGIADYYGLSLSGEPADTTPIAPVQNNPLKKNYRNTVDYNFSSTELSRTVDMKTLEYSRTVERGENVSIAGWSVHCDGVSKYQWSANGGAWKDVTSQSFGEDVAKATKDFRNCENLNRYAVEFDTTGLKDGSNIVIVRGVTKKNETYEIAKLNLTVIGVGDEKIEITAGTSVTVDRATDPNNAYLTGITLGMTASQLADTVENGNCIIKDKDGNTVTGKLGTGYTLTLIIDGVKHETATVIVRSDIDGDAIATSKDVLLAKLYINGQITDNTSKLAADMDNNGSVSVSDINSITQAVANI